MIPSAANIGFLVACLIASFVLSGLESAILSASRVRLTHAAKEGKRFAGSLARMLEAPKFLLISILLLNTSFNLLAFALLTEFMIHFLGPWGYVAAALISLPIYLIWIELTPKSLFKRFAIRLLTLFYPLLKLISLFVLPLIKALVWIPEKLVQKFSGGDDLSAPGSTREEFRDLTEVFKREGTLDSDETGLIQNVLDFHRVRVSEVMLPLSKTTAIPQAMPAESVLSIARETKYDQFPVIAPNGDLVGIVNVMELLQSGVSTGTVENYRHKLVRALPTDTAISVIKRLRHVGHQLAAVYNEKDRPIGVVSVDDMIQRMVDSSARQT